MKKLPIHQYLPQASQLIYGCMGLGGKWTKTSLTKNDFELAHNIVDQVLCSNINVFDYADIYQFGKAEQVFGQVLKERPELREKIIIQSKCGIRFKDDLGPKRYEFISCLDKTINRQHFKAIKYRISRCTDITSTGSFNGT